MTYLLEVQTCTDVVMVNGQQMGQIAYRLGSYGVNYVTLYLKQNSGDELLSGLTFKEGDELNSRTTLSTTFFHKITHVAIPTSK